MPFRYLFTVTGSQESGVAWLQLEGIDEQVPWWNMLVGSK